MGLTVYGGGGKPEEEKTVTAGTSAIEVSPSSGKTIKKVTVNPTPTESKSVTPTTSELTVTPSEGKHLAEVIVGAVEDVTPEVTAQTPVITQILEGLVGKAQGANATADKILEGYSAYVGQKLLHGTAKEGLDLSAFGITKVAVDEIVPASDISTTEGIPHSLGITPKYLIIITDETVSSSTTRGYIKEYMATQNIMASFWFSYTYDGGTQTTGKSALSSTSFKLNNGGYLKAGVAYKILTMA